jgi:hypothetical protein
MNSRLHSRKGSNTDLHNLKNSGSNPRGPWDVTPMESLMNSGVTPLPVTMRNSWVNDPAMAEEDYNFEAEDPDFFNINVTNFDDASPLFPMTKKNSIVWDEPSPLFDVNRKQKSNIFSPLASGLMPEAEGNLAGLFAIGKDFFDIAGVGGKSGLSFGGLDSIISEKRSQEDLSKSDVKKSNADTEFFKGMQEANGSEDNSDFDGSDREVRELLPPPKVAVLEKSEFFGVSAGLGESKADTDYFLDRKAQEGSESNSDFGENSLSGLGGAKVPKMKPIETSEINIEKSKANTDFFDDKKANDGSD